MRRPLVLPLFLLFLAPLFSSVSEAQEYRLRITVRYTEDGAVVRSVTDGGPGSKLYAESDDVDSSASLERGDVITAIDGSRFGNEAEYFDLLEQGASDDGRVRLTVLDSRSGRESDWYVRPQKVQSGEPAPSYRRATAVHVILVGDTDDPALGEHVSYTIQKLIPEFELIPRLAEITEVTGAEVTPANIIFTIDQLQVLPTETILYYHVGHGAYDPQLEMDDPSGGHFFTIGNDRGDLTRKEVLTHLKDKGAQLTVLISDTCNIRAQVRTIGAQYYLPTERPKNRVLADLLLDHHGVIDLSGSSRDQYGWFSKEIGGWFSKTFVEAIQPGAYENDPFVSWPEFLDRLTTDTSQFYKSRRQIILDSVTGARTSTIRNLESQDDQRPQVFASSVNAN